MIRQHLLAEGRSPSDRRPAGRCAGLTFHRLRPPRPWAGWSYGWLHVLPPGHSRRACLTGRTLVTVSRFHPRSALRLIAEYRVTTMALTPTLADLMIRLRDFSSYDVSSLLVVGLGGSLASPSLITRVQTAFGCAVAVGYGSTELGGGVLSTGLIDPAGVQVSAAGRPFPGVQVQVLDEARRAGGDGCRG